jgi:quercetin dioxygenase-like cupin family protein
VSVRLQFNRIPPGVEIGPHRHGVETVVYLAGGELMFQHGEDLERQVIVRSGDVLYEAPTEFHLVRNDGTVDALALLASADPHPGQGLPAQRQQRLAHDPVRRRDEARVVERAGIATHLIAEPGDFGTGTFTVSMVEIAPGVSDAWHRHPGAEHALVVFEGRGTITVGDVEETLEPLKGIRIDPGLTHRVVNTGRTRLRYYVCTSPGMDLLVDRTPAEAPPGAR